MQTCQPSKLAAFKSLLSRAMQLVCSRTDANGFLGRGAMHVISTEQATMLLGPSTSKKAHGSTSAPARWGRLLDIGAGDGNVTAQLAPLFEQVTTTEVSMPMVSRLRRRGWRSLRTMMPSVRQLGSHSFDVVSLFNVLDRCDRPRTLLQRIRQLMCPGGLLLLAVVLPFCPFVEDGPRQRDPVELLPLQGGTCCGRHSKNSSRRFEDAVEHMIADVLKPAGFSVRCVSRVPYISQGDMRSPFYVLDNALFVLESTQEEPSVSMRPPNADDCDDMNTDEVIESGWFSSCSGTGTPCGRLMRSFGCSRCCRCIRGIRGTDVHKL